MSWRHDLNHPYIGDAQPEDPEPVDNRTGSSRFGCIAVVVIAIMAYNCGLAEAPQPTPCPPCPARVCPEED